MKKRILIIDDEMGLTRMMKLNLESTGEYEVLVVNYAPYSIRTAQSFLPDLILLDYTMPGMDGGEVNTQLREDPSLRSVPVIMVTALVSSKEMREDGTAYYNGHLMMAKPIRFEKLKQCIEQQLALRAASAKGDS